MAPKSDERPTPLEPTQEVVADSTLVVFETEVSTRIEPAASKRPTADRRGGSLPPPSRGAALELHEVIGEGGLGLVRRATQTSVGREVAVKTLREEIDGEHTRRTLIREGRVTGRLEHPNIVPVYDVRVGGDGVPFVVLKRIDGRDWRAVMHDGDVAREHFGARDLLEWNLRVLLQVSNALRYAHSRGVIHRDIKPENVMIGAFGEVYLLDWGIALGVEEGAPAPTSKSSALAGTPAYMAPEMVHRGPDAAPLGRRTDVYLLGAVLYEILGGQPPHLRQSGLPAAERVPPPLPDDTPDALRVVVARAMAPHDERYEDVEAFQGAIESYLAQRAAAALIDAADAALVELVAATESDDAEAGARTHRAFYECRFGYRVALDAASDHEAARHGLRRATLLVVEHELASGSPERAALHFADLLEPEPELEVRIEAARAAQRDEAVRVERLTRIGEDLDPDVGGLSRLRHGLTAALAWTVLSLGGALGEFVGAGLLPQTHFEAIVWPGVFLVVLGVITAVQWRTLGSTAFNRRFVAGVALFFMVQIAATVGAGALGIPLVTTEVFYLLLYWAVTSLVALVFVRYVALASVAYLVAFMVAIVWPDHRYFLMAGANAALAVNIAWVYRRRRADGEP